MKDVLISFYEGPIKTTEGNFPTATWTLEQVYDYIVSDKELEAKTNELRLLRASDEKAYKEKKRQDAAVCQSWGNLSLP